MSRRCMTPEAFCDDIFEDVLKMEPSFADINRRFSEALFKTAVDRELTLKAVIGKVSSVPVKKIKRPVLAALLTGSAELIFMKSEAYAVVNDYVNLIRMSKLKNLSGFVNAVLRAVAEKKEAWLSELELTEYLSVPEELYALVSHAYNTETANKVFSDALGAKVRPTVIRRMISKIGEAALLAGLSEEGVSLSKTGLSDDTFYAEGKSLSNTKLFQKGCFYIQDISSAMAVDAVKDLLSERSPEILDLCAAPGGKTFHAADLIKGGHIVSNDRSNYKKTLIDDNIRRFGFDNVTSFVSDASEYNPIWEKAFDLVIADVPCSGLGVIAHKGEIKYRVTEQTVRELSALQKKILENAARYVKSGGTLLYSTCTILPSENSLQIDGFLQDHPAFKPVDFSLNLSECYRLPSVKNGRLQLINGIHPQDGFFIARLKKEKE